MNVNQEQGHVSVHGVLCFYQNEALDRQCTSAERELQRQRALAITRSSDRPSVIQHRPKNFFFLLGTSDRACCKMLQKVVGSCSLASRRGLCVCVCGRETRAKINVQFNLRLTDRILLMLVGLN